MTKLAKKRHECGLSQSGLAEKAEISIRTLQHYEQGDKDFNKASAETVKKIAEALGCSIYDLID